jgi:hypothetical protein
MIAIKLLQEHQYLIKKFIPLLSFLGQTLSFLFAFLGVTITAKAIITGGRNNIFLYILWFFFTISLITFYYKIFLT